MKLRILIYNFLTYCYLCSLFCNSYAEEKNVLIVNKKIIIESITKTELRKIYLGKTALWNGKIKTQPCLINAKTSLGRNFFEEVLDMPVEKFKRYWLRKVFSGYGAPPTSFNSVEEVIEFVSKKEGGIGFIPESKFKSLPNCKILKVDSSR